MKRAVIALTLAASIAGSTGAAFAADLPGSDKDHGNHDNHSVCLVFAQNQKYTDTWYYCISTPDLPPSDRPV
ncbi:MAG: hypothetical protein QOD07_1499 [Frankiaceae bacterium]|jgi:hypothetical protein|nr:hypothetical protein [Frankiaceae bacterium]